MRSAARFAKDGWSQGLVNIKTRKWNGVVRLRPHKLADPLRWRKPSTVFVNSMSDLFHEKLTNEEIAAVFGVMAAAPQHTFQVLTKRAKRMREWFEWVARQPTALATIPTSPRLVCRCEADKIINPEMTGRPLGTESQPRQWPLPNAWIGVSVENQEAADERIPELLATPAAVRFLSCEPLIGEVDLDLPRCDSEHCGPDEWGLADDGATPWCNEHERERSYGHWLHLDGGIDWVIAGCESGPGARTCEVAWLRSLRDQCASAVVPFFLKQGRQRDGEYTITDERPVPPIAGRVTGDCIPVIGHGPGSKSKAGRVIELPYLDGVQHAAFPKVPPCP